MSSISRGRKLKRSSTRYASVHKEHWQLGSSENMLGCTTKDHLPQPTLGVGALDQQICTLGSGLCEKNRTGPLSTIADRFLGGGNRVSLQVSYRLLADGTGDHTTFDTQHNDALGFAQDRYGHCDRAAYLGAGVPVNDHSLAKRFWWRRWRHQHGPPALEEGILQSGHSSSAGARAIKHGQVIGASKTPQYCILDHGTAAPTKTGSFARVS